MVDKHLQSRHGLLLQTSLTPNSNHHQCHSNGLGSSLPKSTDSCPLVWGQKQLNINKLELLAIIKAIKAFKTMIPAKQYKWLQTMTPQCTIRTKWNAFHDSHVLVIQLWLWYITFLMAIHVAGENSQVTDDWSSNQENSPGTHVRVGTQYIQWNMSLFGPPGSGHVCNKKKTKCRKYCSWAGREKCSLRDGFITHLPFL